MNQILFDKRSYFLSGVYRIWKLSRTRRANAQIKERERALNALNEHLALYCNCIVIDQAARPAHLESESVLALVGGPAADPERGEVHGAVLDVAERRAQRLPAHRHLRLPLAARLAPTLLEPCEQKKDKT